MKPYDCTRPDPTPPPTHTKEILPWLGMKPKPSSMWYYFNKYSRYYDDYNNDDDDDDEQVMEQSYLNKNSCH
jgi:hypothetical protein